MYITCRLSKSYLSNRVTLVDAVIFNLFYIFFILHVSNTVSDLSVISYFNGFLFFEFKRGFCVVALTMARSRNVLRPLTLNAFIKIITEKSLFHMSPFSLLFAERQAGSAWYDST